MMVKEIRRDIKLTKWARMLLIVLFVAGMISSVQAATVIWVSDGHETISAGVADDHKWVELLAANGYVVQREDVTMQDSEGGPNLSALNDADLVIISRDAANGKYSNYSGAWNAVKTPMILLNPHLASEYGWNWLNSAKFTSFATEEVLKIVNRQHAILADVSLCGDGEVLFFDNDAEISQISYINTQNAGSGAIIATQPESGDVLVAEWTDTSKEFYQEAEMKPGGRRLLFTAGTQGRKKSWIGAGQCNLTTQGKKMFLNAVAALTGGPGDQGGGIIPALPSNIQFEEDEPTTTVIGKVLTWLPEGQNAAQAIHRLACAYRRLGQYVKSREVYQYIADNWPQDKHAIYSLNNVVISGLETYHHKEAGAAAKKLMTTYFSHPESIQGISLLAKRYRRIQWSAEACALYQYIVTAWPDDKDTIWAYWNIVLCNIGMGDDVATNAAFDKLVTSFSDDKQIVKMVNGVAREYCKRQRYRKALNVYQYVLDNWPENESAIMSQRGIVFASLELMDFIAAENAYNELLANYSQHKKKYRVVSKIADKYHHVGKYVKARDLYQYVADTWPDTKVAMLAQARVVSLNTQIGDETSAKSSMEKLLARYSQHEDIAQTVADIANEYYRFEKYVKARDIYQYITDTWPTDEQALLAQRDAAIASLRLGDDIAANSAVEKAITGFSRDSRLAGVVNDVARQYQILGKYSQARSLYKRVVENWPDDKEAVHSYMGLILANIGMEDDKAAGEAVGAFLNGFSLRKDITKWIIWMASESRCEMKKYDQARKLYQIILDQWPDNKRAMWAQRGIVCIDIGCENYKAAEASITKLFTDISNHEELSEDIEQLIGNFRFTEKLNQAHELYFAHRTWSDEYASHISQVENFLVELCFQLGDKNTVQAAIAYLLTVDFMKFIDGHILRMARKCDRLNQHDGACQLYQKVINTWPRNKYALSSLLDLAILHSRLGDNASSEESIVKLVSDYSNYPGFPKLVFVTAIGYYKEFQKQKAAGYEEQAKVCLERAQKALEIVVDRLPKFRPSNEATLYLADCHRLLGHSEQALAYYQKVVDEYPNFEYVWNAHFQIGDMNYKLKLKNIIPSQIANPIIIREFETILEKYPDSPVARAASQWLQENVY
jgi:tetratricopeptide (TPR) repeat protein